MTDTLRTLWVLLAITVSVAGLSPAMAQETQTISGTLTYFRFGDGNGAELALDSARVEVTAPYSASDSTDAEGRFELSGTIPTTSTTAGPTPTEFVITDVYPNPFGAALRLCTSLPKAGTLTTTLTDIAGRRVFRNVEDVAVGRQCQTIDAGGLAAGTYLVSQRLGDEVITRRITHVPGTGLSAPTGNATTSGTEPADVSTHPIAQARNGDCFDIDLEITRTGFEPVETTVCLPLEAMYDSVLDYAVNTQTIIVTAATGGPIEGATVGIDVHADGEVDTTRTTDASGRAVFALEQYGDVFLSIDRVGYESVSQETLFFSDGETSVELQNLPFVSGVLVTDVVGQPVEGALVEASCDVNGTPFVTEDVTGFEGFATISFDFDDFQRGGDYVLDCDLDVSRGSFYPVSTTRTLSNDGATEVTLTSTPLFRVLSVDATQWSEPLTGELEIFNVPVYTTDRQPINDGRVPMDENGIAEFFAAVDLSDPEIVMKPTNPDYTEGGSWQDRLNDLRHPIDQRRSFTYRHEPQRIAYASSEIDEAITSGAALELTHYAIPNHFYESGYVIANFEFFTLRDPFTTDWSSVPHFMAEDFYTTREFVILPRMLEFEGQDYSPSVELQQVLENSAQFITDSLVAPGTGWEISTDVLPLDSSGDHIARLFVSPDGDPQGTNGTARDDETGLIEYGAVFFSTLGLPSGSGSANELLESIMRGNDHNNPYGSNKLIIGDGSGNPVALSMTRLILPVRCSIGASGHFGETIDFSRFDYVRGYTGTDY